MARDVIEYLDSIDFNKYFESLQKPSARTGEAQKMFLDFSLSSIRAAKVCKFSASPQRLLRSQSRDLCCQLSSVIITAFLFCSACHLLSNYYQMSFSPLLRSLVALEIRSTIHWVKSQADSFCRQN